MNKQIFEDFPYMHEWFSFSFFDAQLHKYVPIAKAIFFEAAYEAALSCNILVKSLIQEALLKVNIMNCF